ncbi:hypothetical protein BDN67DRAFT_984145 [Paxillus ammoniavirescens]|nr:hypothetical protein BDN67DRAFT_984145 [Paxillus ammoniavirescens]
MSLSFSWYSVQFRPSDASWGNSAISQEFQLLLFELQVEFLYWMISMVNKCSTNVLLTSVYCQASTFTDQIVAILNCDESMHCFDLYHIIRLSDAPLKCAVIMEDKEVTVINPALSFIIHVAPEAEHSFKGPRPFCNYFTNPKGFLSSNSAVAFHVTVRPDHTGLVVTEMQCEYNVPHMVYYIQDYIIAASRGNPTNLWKPSAGKVDIWHKFRIQQHSSFRSWYLMKSQVVQAYLGSKE